MNGIGITGIGQIAVRTQDTNRAVAFYRDVLELPFLFQAGTLAFFDAGGVRLMLAEPEAGQTESYASILYYRVPAIEHAHVRLVERGVHFDEAPTLVHRAPDHDLWIAAFRDSEGNLLALMEERRKP